MQGKEGNNRGTSHNRENSHTDAPKSLDHRQEVRSVLMVALAVNIGMSC